jgi:uncharacterized protein (DUF4415 family)
MMPKKSSIIAVKADPNDPEDFDMTEADVERALEDRRRRLRGQQKAPTKHVVTIRLDRNVVDHFKAGGKGWQSRVNDALKQVAGLQ